tara:strand:- start:2129 stop:2428 length:300 start_codon:yes stop_codon:yes gene_type:complete
VKTQRYLSWLMAAGHDIRLVRRNENEPLAPPYNLKIELVRPDKRKRDIGNALKAVEDLLVEHRIMHDDSLVRRIEIVERDGGFKGARVTVRSLERARAT